MAGTACGKAGGSPAGTHQAKLMGAEPLLAQFAPTDIGVGPCAAAQHACWRGESKWQRE